MDKVAEIIKYEGNNKTFVWKYPDEDFNNLTQLIVHEFALESDDVYPGTFRRK